MFYAGYMDKHNNIKKGFQLWKGISKQFNISWFYFQMGTSSYPGMAQSFSMTHGTNMTTVAGMRQDAMGKLSLLIYLYG